MKLLEQELQCHSPDMEAIICRVDRLQISLNGNSISAPNDIGSPRTFNIGDFQIEQQLGKGSFSVVNRVTIKSSIDESNDNRQYALKRLMPTTLNSPLSTIASSDFAMESIILSKLEHKNIIQLQGVKSGDMIESLRNGNFFIVLDLIVETLDDRFKRWQAESRSLWRRVVSKKVSCLGSRIQDIALGISEGMAYLHSENIIFRDLKPSNIGFDKNGIVKIFDFGLARDSIDNTSSSAFRKPRLMTGGAGTPRYMAPEVAKSSRVYGMPADVYSFSILLWQIATRKVPYSEITCPKEFAAKVVNRSLRPNLGLVQSKSLQMIIEQAWSSEPSQRPSFAAIVEGLHAVMDKIESLTETTSENKEVHPHQEIMEKNSSFRGSKLNKESLSVKKRLSKRLKLQPCREMPKKEVTASQKESCNHPTSLRHRLRSSHYLLNAISFRSIQTESEGGESEE